MKVLVTGAGGMLGSHLVEILSEGDYEVLGIYYKPKTDIKNFRRKSKCLNVMYGIISPLRE